MAFEIRIAGHDDPIRIPPDVERKGLAAIEAHVAACIGKVDTEARVDELMREHDKDALARMAEGLDVEATGADGRILKADHARAIAADEAATGTRRDTDGGNG